MSPPGKAKEVGVGDAVLKGSPGDCAKGLHQSRNCGLSFGLSVFDLRWANVGGDLKLLFFLIKV